LGGVIGEEILDHQQRVVEVVVVILSPYPYRHLQVVQVAY
jgi:hypothetical protein